MTAIKDQIRAADDRPREPVDCREWGLEHGSTFVRTMSGRERDAFDAQQIELNGPDEKTNYANLRARLAAATLVDAQGVRIFDDADAQWLGDKSSLVLQRVFDITTRLNGLTGADVDELVKKSGGGPSAASGSA